MRAILIISLLLVTSSIYAKELTQDQLSRLTYYFALNNVQYDLLDEIDCNKDVQVLVIKTGVNKIYKQDNCLFLEGDIEQSIDKIGYSLIF